VKHMLMIIALAFVVHPFASAQSTSELWSPRYQAVVDEQEAVFYFPIHPKPQWEWYGGGLQYTWSVRVRNNRRNFGFGYYLFTGFGAIPPEKGTFGRLLEAGQFSVMDVGGYAENTEEYRVLANNSTVAGFASKDGNQLIIKLSGAKAVRLLFSSKPSSCIFETQMLDEKTSIRIPIIYKSGHRGANVPRSSRNASPQGFRHVQQNTWP
jgi:hypothetical protein